MSPLSVVGIGVGIDVNKGAPSVCIGVGVVIELGLTWNTYPIAKLEADLVGLEPPSRKEKLSKVPDDGATKSCNNGPEVSAFGIHANDSLTPCVPGYQAEIMRHTYIHTYTYHPNYRLIPRQVLTRKQAVHTQDIVSTRDHLSIRCIDSR